MDRQRSFCQWITGRGCVSETEALFRLNHLSGRECSRQDLEIVCTAIQNALRPFDLDLRRFKGEGEAEILWILVSTNGDKICQLATSLSPAQIAQFKLLICKIMSSPHFEASPTDAGGIESSLLAVLMEQKWLRQSSRSPGKVSLGPRSMVELGGRLVEEGLGHECLLCSQLIASDRRMVCSNEVSCGSVHRRCLNAISTAASTAASCPRCSHRISMADDERSVRV